MSAKEEILNEMNTTLDALIENAKQLLEISKQVIAEEELSRLQQRQEELMEKLVKKDKEFQQLDQESKTKNSSSLRQKIDEKLEQFTQLNASFINNIMSTHGLIQFEKGKVKKKMKTKF